MFTARADTAVTTASSSRTSNSNSGVGGDLRRPAKSSPSVPGPVSPKYRGRVPKLSGRYRCHSVKYEPGPYTNYTSRWLPRGYRGVPGRRYRRPPQRCHQHFRVETMGLEPTTPCLQSLL